MDEIVSLCKRRGFIFPGSEVYGGLAGTWDFGPLGVMLKRNIENSFWQTFVESRTDMYGVDAAIIMNPKVWEASGHVATFADPLVEDLVNRKRYRLDHLLEEAGFSVQGLTFDAMCDIMKREGLKSPDGNALGEARMFNMMFSTHVGPVVDDTSVAYLRPETAQGIFTNYKNVVDTLYPDLPFGLAQIGKAFRNEISPRDFVFRSREFNQMEIEYFCDPNDWERLFEEWLAAYHKWLLGLGLDATKIHDLEVPAEDRAHYSKRTVDIEFDYPIGRKELMGIAYRTDFDLQNIQRVSGKNMEYTIKGTNKKLVPHVIEPSIGVERLMMAVMCSAYMREIEVGGDNSTAGSSNAPAGGAAKAGRVVLKLPEFLAPYRFCVSPLLKNKPELVAKAREVFAGLKKKYGNVAWDDNGNIGKRYAKQDEIGTPKCIVIDFDTLEDGTVTVRNRDDASQIRVAISEL
ncbi:MAG: glycine--tRNA ligase [Candidatus Nomurabacteria bacterium]|jgi:glycyl-tRNA synthetase|nr:glycine--tRNA ligase [Candidatus Nomurabacteria bacterium]